MNSRYPQAQSLRITAITDLGGMCPFPESQIDTAPKKSEKSDLP